MSQSQELASQELRVGSHLGTASEKSEAVPDEKNHIVEFRSMMGTAEGTASREDELAEQHNLKRA